MTPIRLPKIKLPPVALPALRLPLLPHPHLSALYRTPAWATDLAVGTLVALFAITVAQAALPSGQRADPRDIAVRLKLRPAMTVSAPAFVFGEPVRGYPVISPFGLRQLPWEEYARLHAGVDVAAPAGTTVQAAADGVVTRAGYDGAYGRFVELRHAGGLTSFYAHLGGIDDAIKAGAAVRLGDALGLIGSTGSSTGSHLHFEVRDAGRRPLNPEAFIGREFASFTDLPLAQAAKLPRLVRIAYVSSIPESKRELMEQRELARLEEEAARSEMGIAALEPQQGERMRAILPGKALPATATTPAKALAAETAGVQAAAVAPVAAPAPAPKPRAPEVLDEDAPIATAAA